MPFPEITSTQQFQITLEPRTKPTAQFPQGKPAKVQAGSVVWASSDPTTVVVVPNPANELNALVIGQVEGTYGVSAVADADLGEGVVAITYQDTGVVVPGGAVSIGAVVGPVEDQP
jgi:hypothetical protein